MSSSIRPEYSDEGKTFQKMGPGPVISPSLEEPFVISGPKIRKFNGKWFLWYVAVTEWLDNNGKPEPVYKVRVATSNDGFDWNRDAIDLIDNHLEKNECQASPDVIYFNKKYHMFFCYKYSLDFRGNDRGYKIGYASSIDLINWVRDDSKAGIDISTEGWDNQSIAYPHVFELDDELYMLYLGNNVGKEGFGLAKLEGC